jgi:hypothetical protein
MLRNARPISCSRSQKQFLGFIEKGICVFSLLAAGTALAQNAGAPNASPGATTPYVINGLALGARAESDSSFRGYQCSPSEQFPDFTRCQRTQKQPGAWPNRSVESSSSILYGRDGKAVYINRYNAWVFDRNEVQTEINRLSTRFGERARELRMPQREGVTNAVIASWGKVQLDPLDADAVAILAAGQSPRKGLLVDYLGDLKRSAQLGLPIYSLNGGAGFVWSSSADRNGRGHLRVLAVDASALSPATAAQPRQGETAEIAKTPVIETASAGAIEIEKVSAPETIESVAEIDKATADKDASFDSVLARLESDLARVEARTATIETVAYRTIFAVICSMAALAVFLLVRRSRAKKALARASETDQVNLSALAQALQMQPASLGQLFEQNGVPLKDTPSPAIVAESPASESVTSAAAGAAAQSTSLCSSCRHEIGAGDKFCRNCGASSTTVAAPSITLSSESAYEALSKAS